MLLKRIRLALWIGLLALLALPQLCFWQDSTDPFAPVELALFKVLLPLALLPWLLGSGADWLRVLSAWPSRWLLAWVAWLWASALLSPFQADGLKTALEYSLEASLFFLPAACSPTQRRALLAAFFAASILAALYGLTQHFGADPWRWSTEFGGRPLGTIGNPNFFGGHLVLAWGLSLAFLLMAPPGHRRWPALAFGLLSLVQWFSRSVGPWTGMATAALAAAAVLLSPGGAWLRGAWDGRRAAKMGAAVLLIGALGLLSGPGRGLLHRMQAEKSASVTNRLMMWKVAGRLWRQAPIQGAGLASYRPLYPQLQSQVLAAEPQAGWNYVVTWLPHQNFLYLLSETGLVGLLLFCGFWALASLQGWRRAAQGERLAFAALLASSGLVGVSLLNTFSNIPPTALGFFFLLGLQAHAPLDPVGGPAQPRAIPVEALIGGLVAALLLGLPAGTELVANRLTREAGRYSKRGDEAGAVAFVRKAAGFGIADLTPQSLVGVQFQLGEALRGSGQVEAAIAAYQDDLKENPWSPEGQNMLGAALGQFGSQRGRGDLVLQSAEHLRIATALNPDYSTAWMNLGGSYAMLGNVTGAAQAWQQVLRIEPQNRAAQGYLAGLKAR